MQTLTPFLRKVLIGGADLTHGLLGLPSALIFWAGVSLIPFIATLVIVIRAGAAPAALIVTIIALNFVWVAASLFVAFGLMFAPTLIGQLFVCAQAAMVSLFAELQVIGLRRMGRVAAPS